MTRTEHLERVAAHFDRWAEGGRAETMELEHTLAARAAFERTRLQSGQSYLDIGCGNGYTVRWACGVHPSVEGYGIDLSENMIKRARDRSKGMKNARFIHGPFPLPELRQKSFDAIVSIETFYYMPDLIWALTNVNRLLKPGGRFVCVVDRYAENQGQHPWDEESDLALQLLSAEAWRHVIAEAGLITFEQSRVKARLKPGEAPSWRHREGSLLMVARRPILED